MKYRFSDQLRCLMSQERTVCVLTGAGISQESGVPTFRGKDGLWNRYDVSQLATPEAFESDPALVWKWYDWRRSLIRPIEPNAGHCAVAAMEKYFEHFTLITQNVDGLHSKAGNGKILTLHGNIWEVRCVREGIISTNFECPLKEIPPHCSCGALLRPNVVWFGESLDTGILSAAFKKAMRSELFIIVGTSGVVYPAAFIPIEAKRAGAYVLEVNTEPSDLTGMADEFIQGPSGEVLPQLIQIAGIRMQHSAYKAPL